MCNLASGKAFQVRGLSGEGPYVAYAELVHAEGTARLFLAAAVIGCSAEIHHPPDRIAETSGEVACEWQPREPVLVSSAAAGGVTVVPSKDGETFAVVYCIGEHELYVTRYPWAGAAGRTRLLSDRSSWALIARGPDDHVAAILVRPETLNFVDERGRSFEVHVDEQLVSSEARSSWAPLWLGRETAGASRTLLSGTAETRVRGVAMHASRETVVPCVGTMGSALRMESGTLLAAAHRSCDEGGEWPAFDVVAIAGGKRSVRHSIPFRDVEYPFIGSNTLVQTRSGPSLLWHDAADCGHFCLGLPSDDRYWIQPLDAAGRAEGSPHELPPAPWLQEAAAAGTTSCSSAWIRPERRSCDLWTAAGRCLRVSSWKTTFATVSSTPSA